MEDRRDLDSRNQEDCQYSSHAGDSNVIIRTPVLHRSWTRGSHILTPRVQVTPDRTIVEDGVSTLWVAVQVSGRVSPVNSGEYDELMQTFPPYNPGDIRPGVTHSRHAISKLTTCTNLVGNQI
jgi:hypothetical protein